MKLWLQGDTARRLYRMIADGQAEDHPRWFVCSTCYWVSVAYRPPMPQVDVGWDPDPCARPRGDLHAEFMQTVVNGFRSLPTMRNCLDKSTVWLDDIAPKVAAAIDTAMRVGSTNAVMELLDGLKPIEIGLDEPPGPKLQGLKYTRPGSVIETPPPRSRLKWLKKDPP